MSNSNNKKSDWYFPPDMVALFGLFFVVIPVVFFGGWIGPRLFNAKFTGNLSAFLVAVVLGAVGTVLLFIARLPLYRQRRFLSFGPRELDAKHRRVYWWAYGFVGASVFLLVALLVFAR